MPTPSEKLRLATVQAIQHIVARLRSRASGTQDADPILEDMLELGGLNEALRQLLTSANKRANLKRVAFPGRGADRAALDAALAAGNTLNSLDALAGPTYFKFEGRSFCAHVRQDAEGRYHKASNGTLRVLYSTSRLTPADRDYLRIL